MSVTTPEVKERRVSRRKRRIRFVPSDAKTPAGRKCPRAPWRETVCRITCPILLITADTERGAIVTPAMAEEAQRLWRTGKVVHLLGAGHNIRREQYAPYRSAVTSFLADMR